jgi:hypothetical protein
MLPNDENREDKYYLPICREIQCGGLLDIKIKEDESLISAVCRRNKQHRYDKLYLKTFENFYMNEISLKKCTKCSKILEDDNIYKCIICDKLYCVSCIINDEHFKENNNNIKLISKCLKHDKKLVNCFDCLQKICLKCEDDKKDNKHSNHKILNKENAPTKQQIDTFKAEVERKLNSLENLFNSIEIWENQIFRKINILKQNIKNERDILIKLFNNNYTQKYKYFQDFSQLFEKNNNDFLDKFVETNDFKEKTKFMFDAIFYEKPKDIEEEEEPFLKAVGYIDSCEIITNFTNDSFLLFSDKKKEIALVKYIEEKQMYDTANYKIKFYKKIISLNYSDDYKKIYACSGEDLSVIIINFDPKANIFQISDENIKYDGIGHFKKCVYLKNTCLITITDKCIYIWNKNDVGSKKYIASTKNFDDLIYDVCKIDNEIVVFSQKEKINFFNLDTHHVIQVINNIDCANRLESLNVIKNCIFINGENGISIISNDTKELIQFIEFFDVNNQIIKIKDDEFLIYYCIDYIYILKIQFRDNNLILVKTSKIDTEDLYFTYSDIINEKLDELPSIKMFVNNNNIIIFQGHTLYLVQKKEGISFI